MSDNNLIIFPFPKRSKPQPVQCPIRERLEQARQIIMEGLESNKEVQTLAQVTDRLEQALERLEAWLKRQGA